MDKESLLAKRDAISRSFDEQTRIKNEAESEQVRLQGEYRLVEELLKGLDEPSKSKKGDTK